MNSTLKGRIKNREGEYQLLFYIGDWKKYIPEQQAKIFIAEALSYCVVHEEIIIKGYLITNKKVALIFICEDEYVHSFLFTLNGQVKKSVHNYLQKEKRKVHHKKEDLKTDELLHDIFHEEQLINDWIIKLIKGQEVKLPYNNPHLNRLKRYIESSNFCSSVDYSGAVGPVKMNKLTD